MPRFDEMGNSEEEEEEERAEFVAFVRHLKIEICASIRQTIELNFTNVIIVILLVLVLLLLIYVAHIITPKATILA